MSAGSKFATITRKGNTIQWTVALALAQELWKNARRQVEENMTGAERTEFVELLKKSKGRPGNLTREEQGRMPALVKKAATGHEGASWAEAGKEAVMILPPEVIRHLWERFQKPASANGSNGSRAE